MRTYLRHRIWNVLEVKELIALEYLDFEGKYKNYSEWHDFWELCFVSHGEITLLRGEERTTLGEGEMLLIPPGCEHAYESPTGNAARAFVVCFESSSSALKALGGIRFRADESVRECMCRVIEESEGTFRMDEEDHLVVAPSPNFGGQQAIIIQLEYLLILLLRMLSVKKNSGVVFLSGEKFYLDLSKVVIQFFEEHIREELTLSDVCTRMNYSRSFLCKTFKRQTGETLMSCFCRMKAEEAGRLLLLTDRQITEIAEHLGFSDAKYFGALFRRYMGCSPTEYRKRRKGKGENEI